MSESKAKKSKEQVASSEEEVELFEKVVHINRCAKVVKVEEGLASPHWLSLVIKMGMLVLATEKLKWSLMQFVKVRIKQKKQ